MSRRPFLLRPGDGRKEGSDVRGQLQPVQESSARELGRRSRRPSSQNIYKEKLQKLGMQLSMMNDQARAAELKKTLGKGWADNIPLKKRPSRQSLYKTHSLESWGEGEGQITFFKPGGPQLGRSERILERKKAERQKKVQDEEKRKDEEAVAARHREEALRVKVVQDVKKIVKTLNEAETKSYARSLVEFEEDLMKIPGVAPGFKTEGQQLSKAPTSAETAPADGTKGQGPSKRNQFTRPPRRVWYTPLPLTVKRYYRTNWKKIRFDVRDQMREKNFWPKLWINFEESHPKMMFELIHAKLAVKQFDEHGFKRVFDWGRGVHPDYVDWILEDMVPHPGQYYYDDQTAVRRASHESSDFKVADWFVKPPKYDPDSPLSPPFDQFDFCGYGNREKSYFLSFTLPREILHYYAPSNRLATFKTIPKPPYAFPGYTFKRWLKLPLEQKLPQYYPFPKRFSMWTRGKIGDAVMPASSEFYLDDPLILKRDLKYNLLHDPHARKFVLQKKVLDKLWELGLINSKGEVKCTMVEFNKNRCYLRDYEWLEECLRRWNLSWGDRQHSNKLTKDMNIQELGWEEKNHGWRRKLDSCKAHRDFRNEEDRRHQKYNQDRYERATQLATRRRYQLILEMNQRSLKKKQVMEMRRRNVIEAGKRRQLMHKRLQEEKHWRAERHREEYYLSKVMEKMEKRRDFWEKLQENHEKKLEHLKNTQEKGQKEFMGAVIRHEMRHHKLWKKVGVKPVFPKEQWELELARKYTRIWMAVVKRRKEERAAMDPLHTTVWTQSRALKRVISLIYEKAQLGGYNKTTDEFNRLIRGMKFYKEAKTKQKFSSTSLSSTSKVQVKGKDFDDDYLPSDYTEETETEMESSMGGYTADEEE